MLGCRLDLLILEVFSNLNDSVILFYAAYRYVSFCKPFRQRACISLSPQHGGFKGNSLQVQGDDLLFLFFLNRLPRFYATPFSKQSASAADFLACVAPTGMLSLNKLE